MVVACRYWYELTDGFWGQFGVTQLPHRHPREILPTGRHLESQLNFAGILEFLSSWSWRGEGLVVSSGGCLVSTASLPLLIDEHGEVRPLGEFELGRPVFRNSIDACRYLLDIASRDLEYRGFRDDRVANFRIH